MELASGHRWRNCPRIGYSHSSAVAGFWSLGARVFRWPRSSFVRRHLDSIGAHAAHEVRMQPRAMLTTEPNHDRTNNCERGQRDPVMTLSRRTGCTPKMSAFGGKAD